MEQRPQPTNLTDRVELLTAKINRATFLFSIIPFLIAGIINALVSRLGLILAVLGYLYALGLFAFFIRRTKLLHYVLSEHLWWLYWIFGGPPLILLDMLIQFSCLGAILAVFILQPIDGQTRRWRKERFELEFKTHPKLWVKLFDLKTSDVVLWRFPKASD